MRDGRKTHGVHEQAHLAQVRRDAEGVAHGATVRIVTVIRHRHRLEGGVRPARADLTHGSRRVGRVNAQPGQQRRRQLVQHLRRKRGVRRGHRRIAQRGAATAG